MFPSWLSSFIYVSCCGMNITLVLYFLQSAVYSRNHQVTRPKSQWHSETEACRGELPRLSDDLRLLFHFQLFISSLFLCLRFSPSCYIINVLYVSSVMPQGFRSFLIQCPLQFRYVCYRFLAMTFWLYEKPKKKQTKQKPLFYPVWAWPSSSSYQPRRQSRHSPCQTWNF